MIFLQSPSPIAQCMSHIAHCLKPGDELKLLEQTSPPVSNQDWFDQQKITHLLRKQPRRGVIHKIFQELISSQTPLIESKIPEVIDWQHEIHERITRFEQLDSCALASHRIALSIVQANMDKKKIGLEALQKKASSPIENLEKKIFEQLYELSNEELLSHQDIFFHTIRDAFDQNELKKTTLNGKLTPQDLVILGRIITKNINDYELSLFQQLSTYLKDNASIADLLQKELPSVIQNPSRLFQDHFFTKYFSTRIDRDIALFFFHRLTTTVKKEALFFSHPFWRKQLSSPFIVEQSLLMMQALATNINFLLQLSQSYSDDPKCNHACSEEHRRALKTPLSDVIVHLLFHKRPFQICQYAEENVRTEIAENLFITFSQVMALDKKGTNSINHRKIDHQTLSTKTNLLANLFKSNLNINLSIHSIKQRKISMWTGFNKAKDVFCKSIESDCETLKIGDHCLIPLGWESKNDRVGGHQLYGVIRRVTNTYDLYITQNKDLYEVNSYQKLYALKYTNIHLHQLKKLFSTLLPLVTSMPTDFLFLLFRSFLLKERHLSVQQIQDLQKIMQSDDQEAIFKYLYTHERELFSSDPTFPVSEQGARQLFDCCYSFDTFSLFTELLAGLLASITNPVNPLKEEFNEENIVNYFLVTLHTFITKVADSCTEEEAEEIPLLTLEQSYNENCVIDAMTTLITLLSEKRWQSQPTTMPWGTIITLAFKKFILNEYGKTLDHNVLLLAQTQLNQEIRTLMVELEK